MAKKSNPRLNGTKPSNLPKVPPTAPAPAPAPAPAQKEVEGAPVTIEDVLKMPLEERVNFLMNNLVATNGVVQALNTELVSQRNRIQALETLAVKAQAR